jgi:Sec-independent protein translocase protein TatA
MLVLLLILILLIILDLHRFPHHHRWLQAALRAARQLSKEVHHSGFRRTTHQRARDKVEETRCKCRIMRKIRIRMKMRGGLRATKGF